MADALAWSGTFHAMGARLLREYAADVGLDAAFTIHDREDSADSESCAARSRLLQDGEAVPDEGYVSGDLLACCECGKRRSAKCSAGLPLVRRLGDRAAKLFGAYVEAKQKQNVLDYDDLLLYWAQI